MNTGPRMFTCLLLLGLSSLGWRPGAIAQNWTQATGIPASPMLGTIAHKGEFYALSLDSVYRSSDGGSVWSPTPAQPGKADNLTSLHSQGDYVLLGTMNDGIYRSSDGGMHWEAFNGGYPGGIVVEFLTLGDSLYVGTGANGVYVRNMAQPSSWLPYNDGLERFGVETMAASGDLLLVNVGLSTYARFRGSPAWTEFLIDTEGGQLAVNKFFRFGDYLFAGVGLGVYRGTAEASGWQKVGINLLPNLPVKHFGMHGKRLFAGVIYRVEHFICYSDDSGSTWGVRDHQLAELISMQVIGDRIFAARVDGLWYFDLGEPTGVDQPALGRVEGFELEQNFPNPFNPVTTIKYTVGGTGGSGLGTRKTMIVVYDLLGREVATIVDEEKSPGSYEARFDGSGLASGMYVYRLTVGSFVQSQKMVLLK